MRIVIAPGSNAPLRRSDPMTTVLTMITGIIAGKAGTNVVARGT